MAQLPEGARAVAIWILTYTVFCLLCNILMLWLLWTSRQILSHIGLICLSILICVCMNLVQQINDNLFWVDVTTARYNYIIANPFNPLSAATNGVTGLDLALWSIRYMSENIAAGLAGFWALALAQAVYGWADWVNWDLLNNCGKITSITIPVIFISLCHVPAIQKISFLFYFFLDFPYFIFVSGGAVCLFMILVKYIKTRRELKTWEVATYVDGRTTWRSFRIQDDASVADMSTSHSMGIYDNWLLMRVSTAFVFMIIFLSNNIIIQINGKADMESVAHPAPATSPLDLSADRATRDLVLLIPSAFPGALALFTFGTTKHFRDVMYRTLVPGRWRRGRRADLAVPQQGRGRETPPLGSTVGNSASGGRGLGRRFADRGSWAAAVSANAGESIMLEDLDGPSEPENVLRASGVRSTSGIS